MEISPKKCLRYWLISHLGRIPLVILVVGPSQKPAFFSLCRSSCNVKTILISPHTKITKHVNILKTYQKTKISQTCFVIYSKQEWSACFAEFPNPRHGWTCEMWNSKTVVHLFTYPPTKMQQSMFLDFIALIREQLRNDNYKRFQLLVFSIPSPQKIGNALENHCFKAQNPVNWSLPGRSYLFLLQFKLFLLADMRSVSFLHISTFILYIYMYIHI